MSSCLHDSFVAITLPESIAVITGILSVWYARRESVLVYPVGIISVLLYVYICLQVKLYADAAINAYYFIVSVYGWYYWLFGGRTGAGASSTAAASAAPITRLSMATHMLYAGLTIALGLCIGLLLDHKTDSSVPYWDGGTTAIFCIAMVLMARKHIEHWIYWIIGDVICVPLFFSKGLCLSSLQYVIFTMIAIAGWITWQRRSQEQHA